MEEERGKSLFRDDRVSYWKSFRRSPSWSSSSSSNMLITFYQGSGDNINDGIDIISELPDVLLHHILSFMVIEDVIRNTSLLSKRWLNLWKSLPILNFHRLQNSFLGFVDRVLYDDRDDKFVLKSLRITYYLRNFYTPDKFTDYFEEWMRYAANNVEELCFYFHPVQNFREKGYELMWPKFSKIQVFKIKARDDLYMPHSLFLDSQLKSLKLEYVSFPKGDKVVTLSCSVLENLIIRYCSHNYDLKLLNISAPKLINLEITNDYTSSTSNCKCKLQISTPNLTSLILRGTLYEGYSFENLSSHFRARIECYEVRDANILRNILEGLHNVTTLELSGDFLEYARSLHMLDHRFLNTFVNLKCLKLSGWPGGSCMHTIHSLLMNTYALETLVLKSHHVRKAHDWRVLFPCIYRLKSFKIRGVRGCENELNLFEFILKNAVVLEDFSIYRHKSFRRHNSREECEELSMKIHSLPRASSSVKILAFPDYV